MTKNFITNIEGNTKQIECLACAIVKKEVEYKGNVFISKHFDIHQDYEIPIPGFFIMASKRHIKSIEEFTEEEQQDFIKTLSLIRRAMREVLKIEQGIIIQNESTRHHFHIWIFPWHEWMKENFTEKIESVRPIMEYAKTHLKTDETLQLIAEAIKEMKQFLLKNI